MKLLAFLFLGLTCIVTNAQSFEEQKAQADELFEAGLFQESYQLYSRLLPNKPRDYELNYKYGASLIMVGDSAAVSKAQKYLDYAVEGGIEDPKMDFFYGYVQEKSGYCGMALEFYKGCLSKLSGKEKKMLGLKERIEHCENALKK